MTQHLSEWADTIWKLDTVSKAYLLVTVLLVGLAITRFFKVFLAYINDPVKQARRYNMTEMMMRRSNLILLIYALFLFYEATLAIYQQPGPTLWKIAIDAAITVGFLIVVLGLFVTNMAAQNDQAGLGGPDPKAARHLRQALSRRGLKISEWLLVTPTLVASKLCLQGTWPIIEQYFQK